MKPSVIGQSGQDVTGSAPRVIRAILRHVATVTLADLGDEDARSALVSDRLPGGKSRIDGKQPKLSKMRRVGKGTEKSHDNPSMPWR